MGEMDADLMRAPGMQFSLEQRQWRLGVGPDGAAAEHRACGLSALVLDPDPTFALPGYELGQRQLDPAHGVAPATLDEHQIALVGTALAQGRVQRHQRRALLGHEQHARGVAVEAVHQFEEPGLWALRTQLLDQAEANAAAAVYREPGRLVDGDERFVLVEDRERNWPRRM